jgi:vitamin B12 transporter
MKYLVGLIPAAAMCAVPSASAQRQVDVGEERAVSDEIVVTAGRTEERRDDVASSIQVVTDQQLDRTVATSFLDLLKKNAAIDVIQYPNGLGGISLRGLRPDFEFTINPRTLVLVDGRPSGSTSFNTVAPESIARVEVLRGPASAVYGASAIGGVVNIITRRSSGPLAGQFTVGGGSFETIRSGATLGGDLAESVDFDLDLGYVRQNGEFRTGDDIRRPNSDFMRASGRGRIGATLSPIVRMDTSIDFSNLDNNAPGPLSFNPQSRSANNVGRVSGDVRVEITPAAHTIRLVAYGSREDYRYSEVPATAPRYMSNNTITRYRGAQAQDTWQALDPLRLTYGFDYQNVTATRASYLASGARRSPSAPNEERETKAVFGEARLDLLGDRLILTAGGRYDWITVRTLATPYRLNFTPGAADFGVFNPRGGAVLKLTDTLRLHGTMGRAFVPAQAIQLAGESEEFAGAQRRVTYGNANLQPERNTTWDAGVGYANSWINADLTYFDSRTRIRITTVIVRDTPTLRETSYVNSDRSRSRGLEGNVALDAGMLAGLPEDRISLNANVTHLIQSEDLLPAGATAIRNVADWVATGSLTLSDGGKFSLTGTVRAVGDRLDTDNSQGRIFTGGRGGVFTYDRFTTVDFSGRWRVTPADTLRLEIANVFDVAYYEKGDYPMAGRTIFARYVHRL